ncbi:transporter [Melaminivora suipulveris]|uniref:Transporter n=1 Tax=Melaminivora suipulveris TaxID=2109913 RepID=A0A2R3QEE6_9BURK|nr:AEC family transporter [Melaminivora suipulveris]AVO50145.1 transporter [Melaminivora suipulveris]
MHYAQLLAPDFLLILLGYLICRFTALGRGTWQAVEGLVYYVLFPALLFQSIVRSPLQIGAASGLVAAGLGAALGGAALAFSLPHLPWLGARIDRRDHAAGAQVAFRFNSFIVLALAERLAGSQGLLLAAVLIGVCVPVVNVAAVWPMARGSGQSLVRELLRNPLVLATVCGLLANAAGFTLPRWLEPTVSRMGAAALVLGLMAAGAGLQWGQLARGRSLTVSLLAIRHAVQPLLGWALARALQLDATQTAVLVAFCAVSTSSTCYVLAARMGYNGSYVAALVTLSTLLGLVSLPLALSLLA